MDFGLLFLDFFLFEVEFFDEFGILLLELIIGLLEYFINLVDVFCLWIDFFDGEGFVDIFFDSGCTLDMFGVGI